MSTNNKMGFWAVFAIVFGSQIGSGIFMLPAVLAPYGMLGIYGWCFAGLGAMLLAFVFAELCSRFPQTGGPHVYVKEVFGRKTAFFIGWAYWLVSWISTSVVVVSAVAYLSPILGNLSAIESWYLETALLLVVVAINCKSVKLSGQVEFALTILKFVPFVIVPLVLIQSFDASCISMASHFEDMPTVNLIGMVTVLSFWGFIGVECATTPAGSVRNPQITIPKAIIAGTLAVAVIYFVNSAAIMGVIPSADLEKSAAPFVDAINVVAANNVSIILSIVASVVCIGTLNAWVLTSAQISLGLAQDSLLPRFFAKKNEEGAPYVSVLVSCIGLVPILYLTKHENFSAQISYIINFSVIVFLIVYIACTAAYIRLVMKETNKYKTIIGVMALLFCSLMISYSPIRSILESLLFLVSGIFVLPFIVIEKRQK